MRRLFVILAVATVMVATMVGLSLVASAESASAQVSGQTVACAPWQREWFVSESGWWYYWSYRWCYNPSIRGSWYVDWAGWYWDGPAPGYRPGYHSGSPY